MTRARLVHCLMVIVLAGGLTGCQAAEAAAEPDGRYSTARVGRGDMADVVQAFGQVAAIDARVLSFDTVSGRVVDILVERGMTVRTGDALVQLDTADLERQLREAEADLTVAQAVLAEAQQDATPAEILRAEAEVEVARYELAKAELDLALAGSQGLSDLRAEVAEKAYALQTAQDRLAMVELTSHASEIRKLEYDVAFFQRALRDTKPDDDTTEFATGLAEAERGLALARTAREAAIRSARDAVNAAQSELSRAQARLQQASAEGYDPAAQARFARERAQQRLAEAMEKLAQAREGPDPVALETAKTAYDAALAKVEGLQAAIDATTLRAPFDAVVYDLYVTPGQYVSASEQIVYLADPVRLRVEAHVSEVDVVRLERGQPVRVRFEPFPTRLVQGEVATVSPRGEPVGGIMAFKVEVSVDKGDLDLRPGMTALLRMVVGERHDVLQIPSGALRQTPDGRFLVDVKVGDDVWEQREIEIGLNDGIFAEVLRGLREGDIVRMPLQEPARQDPFAPPAIVPPSEGEPLPSEVERPADSPGDELSPGDMKEVVPQGPMPSQPDTSLAPASPDDAAQGAPSAPGAVSTPMPGQESGAGPVRGDVRRAQPTPPAGGR